jgi:riboflavin kinase/FMN adenylyltransferase
MKITGKVIQGNKKAGKMGFPTANIDLAGATIEPGIYAGRAYLDGAGYKAAIYISTLNPLIAEAHVLDFDGDLYEKSIELEFYDKVRDDFNVKDEEKLKEIIRNDIEMIRIELDEKEICLPE